MTAIYKNILSLPIDPPFVMSEPGGKFLSATKMSKNSDVGTNNTKSTYLIALFDKFKADCNNSELHFVINN